MPSNKDRLYIVLYTRESGGNPTMPGKEDTYHWALLVGPKLETTYPSGILLHTQETPLPTGHSTWSFEESTWPLGPTSTILARITVGKVIDKTRLLQSLRSTPVRQDDPRWNDVYWVKEALGRLRVDPKGLGTSVTEWGKVRNGVMNFCQVKIEQEKVREAEREREMMMKKKNKRSIGMNVNVGSGGFGMKRVPTFDLMERKEVVA
ncbi:hypothetical protein BJX70DRAFT_394711 [Aspergillus crustosus]